MERVMVTLANQFINKANTTVDIALCGRNRDVFYKLHENIQAHYPSFVFNNKYRIWHTIKTLVFLREKVLALKPDTVLVFGEMWNNLALLALLGLEIPVFVSDRSTPGKNLGGPHNLLRKILYPTASGYIAQTQIAADLALKKKWNGNIAVIGNPILPFQSNSERRKEKIVLSVGRLINTKHYDELIKLFVALDHPEWKLIIVGGNAKKQKNLEKLKQLIVEYKAEHRVFLEGTQPDVASYYQKSSIFALTSSSEGFPNVVGEALSAGLPVVSFDCVAGPKEMIEEGKNGFLVPILDFKKFQKRLEQLMTDDVLLERMAKYAPKSIEKFSAKQISNRFLNFITTKGENNN
ncbi:MAG: galactosyltransferase [Candidatus Brocadia sp. WS118]|nr:MAG: galactosyltransferase [Candidatus Brocadia sp. WS118]